MLFIGRLHHQKGLDWLLSLAPRLFQALERYDLLLVGDGPQRTRLEQLANHLGIHHRVHFAGQRDDASSILAASSILLLPSRWEGMPNVVLEAMAAAKPIVATRVAGVSQLLGPSFQQQSADCGDVDGFAERVIHVLQDEAEADRLGRRNRARAAERFSLNAMVQAYAQLYESLVS
jgi:glycosyltransferase involved in cell wall biosynthesis